MTALLNIGVSRSGEVKFDLTSVLACRRNLMALGNSLATVEQRALGTLHRRLEAEAKRDIRKEYNVPASRLAKDIRVYRTSAGVRITGKFRGIGRINFGARQTSRGVSSEMIRGNRKVDAGSFMATLRNGNRHVVQRTRATRLPLETLYGPTVAQMLRKDERPQRLADYAVGILGKEVDRLLALSGAGSAPSAGD